MYQAEIVGKKILRGLLIVDVSFSDGEDTFVETFETNQDQNLSWLDEQVQRKLGHLNSLAAIKDSIAIGAFVPSEPAAKTDAEIYQEKKSLYLDYMNEARLGSIPYDKPIIVELKEWLKENFRDEYLTNG